MKIIGIGLNRTGTNTLKKCLKHWEFKHFTWDYNTTRNYCKLGFAGIRDILEQYESFDDWPWPLAFREIDAYCPDAKFILTRRRDSETWFRSICKHYDVNVGHAGDLKLIFGFEDPKQNKNTMTSFYNNHLNAVRWHFKHRPKKLLEVCWEDGDGWKELATFLNKPRPNIPFPHGNKTGAGLGLNSREEGR